MQKHAMIPRTDLATEAIPLRELESEHGVSLTECHRGCLTESVLEITDRAAASRLGRPMGRYITLSFGRLWLSGHEEFEQSVEALCRHLRALTPPLSEESGVLVVGLGNREITPDAIGPLTVRALNVTAHLRAENQSLFERLKTRPLAAIAPGVTGQTGIETLALVRGAIKGSSPSLVVLVDALAARSVDRLVTTVQLTDSGISPGSGVGNHRRAFNRKTLGLPVIALGVPTVVDSATLVYDALERAGVSEIEPSLHEVLERGQSFFVSPKESDIAVELLSKLLATALNRTFSIEL